MGTQALGQAALKLVATPADRESARELVTEYLHWVGGIARAEYGLAFDVEAMARSDLEDRDKFFPPHGRFYLVQWHGEDVGIGCLKRLAPGVGEIQRMYLRDKARGIGAGRGLVVQLLEDAHRLGYRKVRLESLKALHAAHALYRSVGFVEIDPYDDNSMRDYHAPEAEAIFRRSVVFMERNAG